MIEGGADVFFKDRLYLRTARQWAEVNGSSWIYFLERHNALQFVVYYFYILGHEDFAKMLKGAEESKRKTLNDRAWKLRKFFKLKPGPGYQRDLPFIE